MCFCVYIGADEVLREVPFLEHAPGFNVKPLTSDQGEYAQIERILLTKHIHEVGGWMGCACSLGFASTDVDGMRPNEVDEHVKALADLYALIDFLVEYLPGIPLKLFCTSWEEFPGHYEELPLDLEELRLGHDLQENVILLPHLANQSF